MDTTTLWLAILGAALGTFAMRIAFLGPWARGRFPKWLENALQFAPPIIFAALITPMILKTGHEIPTAQLFSRVLAVIVTFCWAFRFEGQVWPLVGGMLTLHVAQMLLR